MDHHRRRRVRAALDRCAILVHLPRHLGPSRCLRHGRQAPPRLCRLPGLRARARIRTHQARSSDPYLLYLVRTRRWQKFGVGGERRVHEHRRRGAEVIQVLRAPFAQVVLAETILKQLHGDTTIGRVKRGMIASFGQGTEVVHRRIAIRLTQVLPDGEDVTTWFR